MEFRKLIVLVGMLRKISLILANRCRYLLHTQCSQFSPLELHYLQAEGVAAGRGGEKFGCVAKGGGEKFRTHRRGGAKNFRLDLSFLDH